MASRHNLRSKSHTGGAILAILDDVAVVEEHALPQPVVEGIHVLREESALAPGYVSALERAGQLVVEAVIGNLQNDQCKHNCSLQRKITSIKLSRETWQAPSIGGHSS